MADTVGTYLLRRLCDWGITRVYGYPGDGINGIMGGFHHVENLEFIQVRHEEMAAFMACAHAKFTGQVGICLATSGPGAIHLLNGLYDAKLDHQPVVAPMVAMGASRRARRSAAIISRRWISSPCSRMWSTSTCTWRRVPCRSASSSTARSASHVPSER